MLYPRAGDRTLGMDRDITRRDFLNATLLASGGLLLNPVSPAELLADQKATQKAAQQESSQEKSSNDSWTGYGGVGDYANSNGNTQAVFEAGHQIRDGLFDGPAAAVVDTGETFDLVVVGGGISGLAAALIFQRQAGRGKTCLVLDNHPIFGGEAKRNEFLVDGRRLTAHQGSALFQINYPHSFIVRFYESIGLDKPRLEYQKWAGPDPEMQLPRTPYLSSAPYGLYFGAKFGQPQGVWLSDPWGKKLEGAPISATAREELLKTQSPRLNASAALPGRCHLAPARHDDPRRPHHGEVVESAEKLSEHFSRPTRAEHSDWGPTRFPATPLMPSMPWADWPMKSHRCFRTATAASRA